MFKILVAQSPTQCATHRIIWKIIPCPVMKCWICIGDNRPRLLRIVFSWCQSIFYMSCRFIKVLRQEYHVCKNCANMTEVAQTSREIIVLFTRDKTLCVRLLFALALCLFVSREPGFDWANFGFSTYSQHEPFCRFYLHSDLNRWSRPLCLLVFEWNSGIYCSFSAETMVIFFPCSSRISWIQFFKIRVKNMSTHNQYAFFFPFKIALRAMKRTCTSFSVGILITQHTVCMRKRNFKFEFDICIEFKMKK